MIFSHQPSRHFSVCDPWHLNVKLAKKLGADITLDPTSDGFKEQVDDHTKGRGGSLVIECSGNRAARGAMLDVVGGQGRIIVLGITAKSEVSLDIDQLIFKSARIIGSEGSGFAFERAMSFMDQASVDFTGVITHTLPLTELKAGFELAAGRDDACKVLLRPSLGD